MIWNLPEKDNKTIIERIYTNRNIKDLNKFLNPNISNLYDPFLLHDMQKAVDKIVEYVEQKKKIFIHGDYDVDGISSTTLLWNFLYRGLNANVLPYIPSRFTEGYGLSEESINAIIKQGGEVIITVDCGIKDIEIVKKYSDKIKFIITDHHNLSLKENFLEDSNENDGWKRVGEYVISSIAEAVVHPKLNNYPFKELCGAGVALKLCIALNNYLKLGLNFNKYFELACLGTICDVMPLIDENRIIVRNGIDYLRKSSNYGLISLLDGANVKQNEVDTYHIGFVIGPRLNASGRLESAIDAVRLLSTQDHKFAKELSIKLEELNKRRQKLTADILSIAEKQVEDQSDKSFYFILGEEWAEGIIGLIAGKLTEKYQKPVIVGSIKDGIIKASARSIEVFDITKALTKFKHLLITFGGHSQAAGLSFNQSNLNELKEGLEAVISSEIEPLSSQKKIQIDGVVKDENLLDLAKELCLLAPFGSGNIKPRIALLNWSKVDYKVMGAENNHIRLRMMSRTGQIIEAIKFSDPMMIKEIAKHWEDSELSIVGSLEINYWNSNEKVQLKIEDYKFNFK